MIGLQIGTYYRPDSGGRVRLSERGASATLEYPWQASSWEESVLTAFQTKKQKTDLARRVARKGQPADVCIIRNGQPETLDGKKRTDQAQDLARTAGKESSSADCPLTKTYISLLLLFRATD